MAPCARGAFPDLPQSPRSNGSAGSAAAPAVPQGYVAPHLRGTGAGAPCSEPQTLAFGPALRRVARHQWVVAHASC